MQCLGRDMRRATLSSSFSSQQVPKFATDPLRSIPTALRGGFFPCAAESVPQLASKEMFAVPEFDLQE